jgi:hypothetical protein
VLAVAVLALGATGVANAGVVKRTAAARVTVTFTDTTLRVTPANPGSGATTFLVVNKGKKHHVLAIAGPGIKGAHSAKLPAGGHTTLKVTLRPGTYILSDPVGLGAYTSAYLAVVKSAVLSARGDASETKPDVAPPPMCGIYFTP